MGTTYVPVALLKADLCSQDMMVWCDANVKIF